ncbi:MAG: isoprenylcysteine carboxylmethyltransferase family protein [Archaeoglobus sp.]|nr:isoprenylcysteine carboxylmethyltransferase family protein [Archaeoglobus sp.]
MKNKILKWSKKEYNEKQRMLALIPEAILFVVVLPFVFWVISGFIEVIRIGFPNFIGLLLIPFGLFFSAWSVWVQFKIGKGTPSPAMPTQRLVVEKPYAYCRNPMIFGIMLYYLGLGVWLASLSFIGIVTFFVALLLIYVKLVEEKELEERFGEEYVEYKKRTPFLFPPLLEKVESE